MGELESLQRELAERRREVAELRKEHAKASSDREQYRALYVVVASGGLKGNDSAFTIQAFAPGESEPLWVYTREDADLLHLALTLTLGPYGEVYAGGFGANGYPAVAYIFG